MTPHIEAAEHFTVATSIDSVHSAPTLPGVNVTLRVDLRTAEGNSLTFTLGAQDDAQTTLTGTHSRRIVSAGRFAAQLAERRKSLLPSDT